MDYMMNEQGRTMLYLIGGVPGAGKSTLAKKMVQNGQADVHFEADMYFEKDGEYRFDPRQLKYAHEWCQNEVEKALIAGKNVVVSNTFTMRWERETYYAMAICYSHNVEFIKLDGGFKSVHDVPEEKIQKMRARWED